MYILIEYYRRIDICYISVYVYKSMSSALGRDLKACQTCGEAETPSY